MSRIIPALRLLLFALLAVCLLQTKGQAQMLLKTTLFMDHLQSWILGTIAESSSLMVKEENIYQKLMEGGLFFHGDSNQITGMEACTRRRSSPQTQQFFDDLLRKKDTDLGGPWYIPAWQGGTK